MRREIILNWWNYAILGSVPTNVGRPKIGSKTERGRDEEYGSSVCSFFLLLFVSNLVP